VRYKDLFSCEHSILKVHGCIQKENVIISINPNYKHNFIHVNLAKKLQISTKHFQSTHVDDENFQIFKDLKVSMDTYVLISDF